jgi:sugar/nucleoside kinase (ribokinase family)
MNTFLGAAQHLPASALDEEQIRGSAILYLEGYLWDPETPRYAMIRAIEVAREAGRKVAFTLSDIFCVERHRDGFKKLLDEGRIDILFANQAEVEALAGVPHLESAVAAVKDTVETLVVTRSEDGALATRDGNRAEVVAKPIDKLVDTTGAGDLFASGFLVGEARGLGLERSLQHGAVCAAEVIQHYGARPEADLRALVGTLI